MVDGVVTELHKGEGLPSFPKCDRERMCLDGVRVFHGDVRMIFPKSELTDEGFSLSSSDYGKALNVTGASNVKRNVKHEQKAYANHKFGAQRKRLSSFVSVRRERNERNEMWAGRVLVLLSCLATGESDGNELAFVPFMDCLAPLDEVREALK